MIWKDNEEGPLCTCGHTTTVKIHNGKAILMCLFHTYEEGASWALPSEHKPSGWPYISNEEIERLIQEGIKEEHD